MGVSKSKTCGALCLALATALVACGPNAYQFAVRAGADSRKVGVRLDSGQETFVEREQLWLVPPREGDELMEFILQDSTLLTDLEHELAVGDRLFVQHTAIEEYSGGEKFGMVFYDVIVAGLVVATIVVTYGSGVTLVNVVLLNPRAPKQSYTVNEFGEFTRLNVPAAMISFEGDTPKFENVERSDAVAFYWPRDIDEHRGPATTENVSYVDVWGDAPETARPIGEWMRFGYASYISGDTFVAMEGGGEAALGTGAEETLIGGVDDPFGYGTAVYEPLICRIRADARSAEVGDGLDYTIRCTNEYSPEISKVVIAFAPPDTLLRLENETDEDDADYGTVKAPEGHDIHYWVLDEPLLLGESCEVEFEGIVARP
ncbi:MAG: hypothetical protein JRI55_24180 [Deltaproteobacteria bacterium]|jgi:hypothetical protein|nr:hypothetical protein [Deltaproteobacteria bacterium]